MQGAGPYLRKKTKKLETLMGIQHVIKRNFSNQFSVRSKIFHWYWVCVLKMLDKNLTLSTILEVIGNKLLGFFFRHSL